MIIRHLERQPVRALLSVFGMSLALTVLVVGSFVHGALNHLMDFLFFTTQRQDVTVSFVEPRVSRALGELGRLPGVLSVEPLRTVPVRFRAGPHSRLQAIVGATAEAQLDRLVDEEGRLVPMPKDGLVLGNILAEELHVNAGDEVQVEVLEGQRPIVTMPVAAIARTYAGEVARMDINALNRLMREGSVSSGAALDIDESRGAELDAALKALPNVASVSLKQSAIASFQRTIAENIMRMRFINVLFASVIAFGVVYNSARVALAERAHELATLRVLGFRRSEVSAILLGELAVLVIVATPIGLVMGRLMAQIVVKALEGNIVRIPLIIEPRTYLFAVTVVAIAALVSGLIVRRGVDHLDLVEVLKTKG
jgi:putative ABC transport system permease protein